MLVGFLMPWLGFALLVRRAAFTRNGGGGRGWPGPLWRDVGSVDESGPLPRTSTAGVGWASSAVKGATGPGNGRGEPNEGRKVAPLGRSARRNRGRRGSGPSRCPEGTRAPTRGQGLGGEESRGVWEPPPPTSSLEGALPAITRPGLCHPRGPAQAGVSWASGLGGRSLGATPPSLPGLRRPGPGGRVSPASSGVVDPQALFFAVSTVPLEGENSAVRGTPRAGIRAGQRPSENHIPPLVWVAPSRLIIKQRGKVHFCSPFSFLLFSICISSSK